MTSKTTHYMKGYKPMKKTLLIAVLAVALVFAFAATASARPNPNIYIAWDAGATGNANGPHADYSTSSTKCNVCHAVHYAATSDFDSTTDPTNASYKGTWSTGGEETQMLLRSSVANSCNYCHIDTAVGGVQIWGGDSANYPSADALTGGKFSHQYVSCTDCHAVHGANTFEGGNISKILRIDPRAGHYPIQPQVLISENPDAAITPLFADTSTAVASADKYLQQVAFCSQCHAEYTTASDATITGTSYYSSATSQPYKSHPIVADINNFQAGGATQMVGGQVAYVNSESCRMCHDAGGTDQTGVSFNSYPHYTKGYFRFQTSAADAAAAALIDATTLVGGTHTTTAAEDGNCLKCHVAGDGLRGVGIDF